LHSSADQKDVEAFWR